MSMSRKASTRASPAPKCFERCSTLTTELAFGSTIFLARSRKRHGRVYLERKSYAEAAGGETDSNGNDEDDGDIVRQDDEAAREIALKDQNEDQAEREADQSHRQRLLDNHADDGPIRRSDEFEGGDRSHLVHRKGIDDQRDDDRRHDDQQDQDHELLPTRFLDDLLAQQGLLLFLGQRRQVLPPRERRGDLPDRHVRRYFGEDGVDLIARFQGSAARDLAPLCWWGKLELQCLGVEQSHVGDGIAGIGNVVPRQAHNAELVTMRSEWNL